MQPDAAKFVGQQNGKQNADDQKQCDHRGSPGGQDIVRDQILQAAHMVGLFAQRRGQNGRGEDANAVGAEVLQEPRNGSEDGGTAVALVEQCHEGTAAM